jgi:hypothetical protein
VVTEFVRPLLEYICCQTIAVDESYILDKLIMYHMDFMKTWIDLYDKNREEVL